MDEPVISINEDPYGFYTHYFKAIAASQANTAYCEQLFGSNMGQHGFAEVSHLDHPAKICSLGSDIQALDLGCGNG